jgi:dihydrofolate synthase / folylpolyglutamate synthase
MATKKTRRGGGEPSGKQTSGSTTPADRTSADDGAKMADTASGTTKTKASTPKKSTTRKPAAKKTTLKEVVAASTASAKTSGNKKSSSKKSPAKKSPARKPAVSKTSTVKAVESATEPKAAPASKGRKVDKIGTYNSAARWILELTDVERQRVVKYDENGDFKLDRMRSLLAALGDPQDQFRAIHVAGSNGKGSTIAMISAMLRKCGYGVGEFTSPHLVDIRERICINGQRITKNEFTESMKALAKAATEIGERPTFFEAITAISFMHFAAQAVDVAIVEVGLGGRLDSTNVIMPVLSVITEIQLDHTKILGTTLEKIAVEKAGIIKPGVPVITREQQEDVDRVLREKAESVGTTIRVVNKEIEFSNRFCSTVELGPHNRVCLYTETSRLEHLPVPLPGEHQAFNCGLALAAVDHLKSIGFECPESVVTEGLEETVIPGRMQLVWDRPRILVDGAHNPDALTALMRCVGAHVPYDSMVCVFGCGQDKDVDALLDRVSLGADKVIFTKAVRNTRAVEPEELRRRFMERSGKMCQTAGSVKEALELAARAVSREDLICVTGSFYLVGETIKHLEAVRKSREDAASPVG